MKLRYLLFVSLLSGTLSLPAAAVTYCISSTSGLNSAISSSNAAAEGSDHDLRLRPGTYNVPSGLTFDPAGDKDAKDFSITGGWNSDCSARTINASATVVNADNGSSDGNFRFFGNNTRYIVEGIRFINFSSFLLDDANCNIDCPDTSLIRVRYNEFRFGNSVFIRAKDAAQLTVVNNLFANLTTHSGETVRIDYTNNENVPVIAFNTIGGINCSSGAGTALAIFNQMPGATVHHNVVQQVGCGAHIQFFSGSGAQPVALRNNLYNVLSGLAPSVQSGNVVTGLGQFVDAAAGDYRLRETAGNLSLAINAGMTPTQASLFGVASTIPSQDLDGPAGMRLIGTRYDMGAYESSINDSSVITVTNANNSGAGSLRAAIDAANAAPGLQKIEFNIPGSCLPNPHIISLQSPLPDITDSLEIDGYSEPEASANTSSNGSDAVLCIVILAQSGTLAQALQVPVGAAAATSLMVKGIAFAGSTGFNGNFSVAIRLRGGSNHAIQGNAFAGVGPGSIGSLGTMNFGLQIRNDAQNALIGGADPEHRNSFGAMSSSAIVLNDATSGNHRIQNNYIGLSASGTAASSIGLNGIFASDSPNVQILDNVISSVADNAALQIQGASATGYVIARNKFGVSAFGVPTAALKNRTGIGFAGGTGNHVVGNLVGLTVSNLITNSEEAGVWITTSAGTGIVVRPNQIFDNGKGGIGLGIDLGPLGQSVNDPQDPDSGPNNGQNYPEILSSLPNAEGNRQLAVTLDSKPSTAFRIDIYRTSTCPGGARGGNMLNRVGTITTSSNAAGIANANFVINGAGAPGLLVATATNLATNDTSEPSLCYLEPIATTTQITSDAPDPSAFGQPYTVSVLVSAASGTPAGSVTVNDGSGSQCQATLNGASAGSCQLLSTSIGNKTLTASYPGSFTHAPSSGTAAHAVVAVATTTTIVSDTPDPSQVGEAYTVSVQVRTPAGNLAIPSGSVAVSDGTGQTCQIVALNNGDGSCQLTSVTAGNKTLNASYAGTTSFLASSGTTAHTVVPASTTTTITSDAPDPSLPGQAYTVAVSVTSIPGAGTPIGSVAVSDGSGANCNITLANGGGSCQLTSTTPGNKTLTATYAPSSQAFAVSSDTEPHTVNSPQAAATTTEITADTPDPSVVGQPFTVSVSVSSAAGTVTGQVNVNSGAGGSNCVAVLANGSGSCQLTGTVAGAPLLTACMQANTSFAGSCDTENHSVIKASTSINAINSLPATPVEGQMLTVGVVLTVTAPGAGSPTGTISVTTNIGESCTITFPASSCQMQLGAAGNRTLSASYSGDANFNASNGQTPLQVQSDQLLRNGFEN